MLDSSKKQILSQVLITLGVVGGLAAIALGLAFHLDISLGTVFEKKSELDLRKVGTAELDALLRQAEAAGELTEKLSKLLPSQDQAEKFSDLVNGQSSKNKIVTEINLADTIMPKPDQPGVLRFNLKASGVYSDLLNFLRGLENGTLPIAFEETNLIRKDGHFELSAKVKIFFK